MASFVFLADRWIESWLPRLFSSEEVVAPVKEAPEPESVSNCWSLLCRSILAFICAAFLSLIALGFFFRIYRGGASGALGEDPSSLRLLLLCTFVVILANLVVSLLFHKPGHQALLASFLAALVLLGAGNILGMRAEAALPAKIMERIGFGGQPATLVLTYKGGRLLCQHGIPVEFEEREGEPPGGYKNAGGDKTSNAADDAGESGDAPKKKAADEGPLARSSDLTILSRLGSEYLLRYKKDDKMLETTVALPKDLIVSWSTGWGRPIVKNGCMPKSAPGTKQDVPAIRTKAI